MNIPFKRLYICIFKYSKKIAENGGKREKVRYDLVLLTRGEKVIYRGFSAVKNEFVFTGVGLGQDSFGQLSGTRQPDRANFSNNFNWKKM